MSQLIRLKDIQATHSELLGNDYFDPTNKTAYAANEEKIGKLDGALVEEDSGRIRYLIVEVGGWFSSKEVLVPAGMARIVNDNVYFDSLTKAQVEQMEQYDNDYNYSFQEQSRKDQAILDMPETPVADVDNNDHYKVDNKLELLEERLVVNKEKIIAGLVSIGKHVVTEKKTVGVELTEEEAHINRTNVERRTDRTIGEDANAEISVELEAERANVGKETYVTEEVEVGKTQTSRTEQIEAEVSHEELDVNRDGTVRTEDHNRNK